MPLIKGIPSFDLPKIKNCALEKLDFFFGTEVVLIKRLRKKIKRLRRVLKKEFELGWLSLIPICHEIRKEGK